MWNEPLCIGRISGKTIANMIIEGLARAISLVFRTYGEIYDPLNSCGIAVHKKQG